MYDNLQELTAALLRAQKAHHLYEAMMGKTDDDWAEWYARYMLMEYKSVHEPIVEK